MRISNSLNAISSIKTENNFTKPNKINDYSNYLRNKFPCLTPGTNVSVSITGGLLRKAMTDEKTGEWLERDLAKVPDYIKAAQQSAIAHGGTLKSVSIEYGEEYTTMTTVGVYGDEKETDPDIDKWLEKIKKKKEEQKKVEDKKLEEHLKEERLEQSFLFEFKGIGIEDVTDQLSMKLKENMYDSFGLFDIKA